MKSALFAVALLGSLVLAQDGQNQVTQDPQAPTGPTDPTDPNQDPTQQQQQPDPTPDPTQQQQPDPTPDQDQDQGPDTSDFSDSQQATFDALGDILPDEITVLPDAIAVVPQVLDPLDGDDDGFTVFAPQDAPLNAVNPEDEDALADILAYHISTDPFDPTGDLPAVVNTTLNSDGLEGDPQVVIVSEDDGDVVVNFGLGQVTVTNPVSEDPNFIHVIDGVMEPPVAPSETAANLTSESLSQLVSALGDANLVDTIDDATKITIFAPNDAAFNNAGNINSDGLETLLQYHVITSVAYSPNLESGTYETLEGRTLEVAVDDDGTVTVNGVSVILADVLTSNGVIHVIEEVLNPDDGGEVDEDTTTADPTGADADAAEKVTFSVFAVIAAALAVFA